MRQIAIYGKGGIDKSATTQNTVAGLSDAAQMHNYWLRPEGRCNKAYTSQKAQSTVMDMAMESGTVKDLEIEKVLLEGFKGIKCAESGGPKPGVGCANRGVITEKFGGAVMNGLRIWFLAVILAIGFAASSYADDKVAGSASVGIFNRYIFRGYEIGSNSIVVQPALNVSYKGFSGTLWGNIDSDEHPTQSFMPDREGHKSFNEIDLTLSYTYAIDKLSLTGGYIYYGTKYAPETEELFLSASYDVIAKPTLTIYRDITSFPGTYINLSLSHSEPVYKDITLDLGASFGYFSGDDDAFRTEGGTGKKYRAFHDGMLKAGFTVPVDKNFAIQPIGQYWFPLSDKAKRHGYNPNGHLDDTFVMGINMIFNF